MTIKFYAAWQIPLQSFCMSNLFFKKKKKQLFYITKNEEFRKYFNKINSFNKN